MTVKLDAPTAVPSLVVTLIGPEPAAYFSDACRIMDGAAGVAAQTHLAAHLLREIEGRIHEVLEPMLSGDAKQRISVEEALRAWTLGGAFASFDEARVGSISVGKLADFVVLSDDPTRVESRAIKDIKVEQTVIGGRIVWDGR